MRNLCLIADGISAALLALAVMSNSTPEPKMAQVEVTPLESQQPLVVEEHEAPPIEQLPEPLTDDLRLILPTPKIHSTYAEACEEATRARELLIVHYTDEAQRSKAIKWLDGNEAAKRFVWLLKPSASPSVVAHNVVTGESRRITKPEDLEN